MYAMLHMLQLTTYNHDPVAFCSTKFQTIEIDYKNHYQEHLLEVCPARSLPSMIIKNSTHFQHTCFLNQWQTCQVQFLTHFDFLAMYWSRIQQGKAYALAHSYYVTPPLGELTFDNQKQVLYDFCYLMSSQHLWIWSFLISSI